MQIKDEKKFAEACDNIKNNFLELLDKVENTQEVQKLRKQLQECYDANLLMLYGNRVLNIVFDEKYR